MFMHVVSIRYGVHLSYRVPDTSCDLSLAARTYRRAMIRCCSSVCYVSQDHKRPHPHFPSLRLGSLRLMLVVVLSSTIFVLVHVASVLMAEVQVVVFVAVVLCGAASVY